MKTKTMFHSRLPLVWSSVLALIACAGLLHAQTTLNLDTQPSFDFNANPQVDPLFAPETIGLTSGTAAFNRVAALSAFATAALESFPQSYEVFLGYWGNPRYGYIGIQLFPMPEPTPPPQPASPPWNYSLLPSSRLIDDCPICDRLPFVVPMVGTFQLRLIDENPLFTTYAVEQVAFDAIIPDGTHYTVAGQGLYQVGGEVGPMQNLFLELWIKDSFTNKLCYLTNSEFSVSRPWPLLQISVDQTNGNDLQVYHLQIVAAPVREIWFSTTHSFTPGIQPPYTNRVSAGDLVSSAGHVVKPNRELAARLGRMPSPDPTDLGLDAVDILPGGEIAFSTEVDAFSQTLGELHHGDVLSNRGRVASSWKDLIAPFSPMPPMADPGLDAVQLLDSGEIYFSVETGFFSQKLGVAIKRGDLLSSTGRIVKTAEKLLSQFHPPPIPIDYGLDAIYVWPSGEVWFSLEQGFNDDVLDYIAPGDLLSDRGERVYRNRDLLRPFEPLEELADFGLDALYIVSDATLPAGPARCTRIELDQSTGDILLQWTAAGHVFQLEKASIVTGPYLPLGPITTDLVFIDPGALTHHSQAFYRLRQW